MKRYSKIICLATWFVIALYGWNSSLPAQTGSTDKLVDSLIRVRKINDKTVIVSLGPDAVTAIATKKGIVVIDAGLSASLTSKYREIIQREFKRDDFTYLINTHGHRDHTWGNIAFGDAVIIGQENCLKEMSDQLKDPEKVKAGLLRLVNEYDKELKTLTPGTDDWDEAFCQKARYQYAYRDVLNNGIIKKPTVTFTDTLNMDMGDVTFHLIWFGTAHSESDILVFIPGLKLLMVGDLFSKYGRPSIPERNMTNTDRWLKVMDWVEARSEKIVTIIGGHGQVLTKEDLDSFDHFVRKTAGH